MIFEAWLSGNAYNLRFENFFSPFFNELYLFAVLGFLMLAEIFFCGWKKGSAYLAFRSGRTGYWDVFSVVIYASGVRRVLLSVFTLGFSGIYYSFAYRNGELVYANTYTHQWPLWLKYVAVTLAYDFLFYWSHRWKHQSPWLWNLHEFHHSSEKVNLLTTYRSHPLDSVLHQLTIAAPISFLFDLSVTQSLYFLLISGVFGLVNHSRLDTDFGILGRHLLVSPRMHHLHHSKDRLNSNFGEIFIIWDKIFGTYSAPEKALGSISQGIEDNFYQTGPLLEAYVKPAARFYRKILPLPKCIFRGRAFSGSVVGTVKDAQGNNH